MTQALPAASEASVSNGVWFVIPVGTKTIRAWGSNASGLERIYVDETVVSERRSVRRASAHEFVIDGERYSVTFEMSGLLNTRLVCTLASGDVPMRAFLVRFDSHSAFLPKRLALSVLACVLIGIVGGFLGLPVWAALVLSTLVLLMQFNTRTNGGFKVEEVEPVPGA